MFEIKKEFNKMAVMLIPIAIAINFVGGTLTLTLKMPIYLDMIGTFLLSMLGGPWIAAVTGALSIILKSINDPTELPYSLLAAALGFVAGILAKRGMFDSTMKTIFSGLIVALIAVVASVMIRVTMYGGFGTGGTSGLAAAFIAGGMPFWPAQFLSQFIGEIPDKLLSVYIPLLVISGMSDRYLVKFPNGRMFMKNKK